MAIFFSAIKPHERRSLKAAWWKLLAFEIVDLSAVGLWLGKPGQEYAIQYKLAMLCWIWFLATYWVISLASLAKEGQPHSIEHLSPWAHSRLELSIENQPSLQRREPVFLCPTTRCLSKSLCNKFFLTLYSLFVASSSFFNFFIFYYHFLYSSLLLKRHQVLNWFTQPW